MAEFASVGRDVVTLIRPARESSSTIVATASQRDVTTMMRMRVDGTLEEVGDYVDRSVYDDVPYYSGDDRAGL